MDFGLQKEPADCIQGVFPCEVFMGSVYNRGMTIVPDLTELPKVKRVNTYKGSTLVGAHYILSST